METSTTKNHQTIAAGIHLLTFGKWIIPLGNFILPLILWMVNSKKSQFIDRHGKQALNFQISITLYTVILAFIGGGIIIGTMISGGPMLWENIDDSSLFFTENMGIFSTVMASGIICGTAIFIIGIMDLVCTIQATIKALDGEEYKYPLTINFIPMTPNNDMTSNNESINNQEK